MRTHTPEPSRPTTTEKASPTAFLRVCSFIAVVFAMWVSTFALEACSTTPSNETVAESVGKEPSQSKETTTKTEPSGKEPTLAPEPPGPEPPGPEPKPEPTSPDTTTQTEDTPETAPETTPEAADGGPSGPCTGISPPYPSADAGAPAEIEIPENLLSPEYTLTPDEVCTYKPGQCPGSETPVWMLEDFQPQSCGYQKSYNLKAFRGYVTVVALLSGW